MLGTAQSAAGGSGFQALFRTRAAAHMCRVQGHSEPPPRVRYREQQNQAPDEGALAYDFVRFVR
jgi:hypothetical protein